MKYFLYTNLIWSVSRSSGPGGQYVNKTNSQVMLEIALDDLLLNDIEKKRVAQKLKNRINKEGVLSVTCQTERDQKSNKEAALKFLIKLIEKALYIAPQRIATKVPYSAQRTRIQNKKNNSIIKKNRSKIKNFDEE